MHQHQPPKELPPHAIRGWIRKFQLAFRGIGQGVSGQSSFVFHLTAALSVVVLASILQVSLERWCLLILCIGVVLAGELFNSSLEWVCRSTTSEYDPHIEKALNIASASVLVLSVTAAIVGGVIFLGEFL